jgi:hypothetical protein
MLVRFMALQEDPDPRKYSTYLATCLSSDRYQYACFNASVSHGTAGGP